MTYHFPVRAATKADAKAQVETKFDEIVASQPAHASDKAAVLANVGAAIDLLDDDVAKDKDVTVTMNGWIITDVTRAGEEPVIVGVVVAAQVGLADRLP